LGKKKFQGKENGETAELDIEGSAKNEKEKTKNGRHRKKKRANGSGIVSAAGGYTRPIRERKNQKEQTE